MTTHVGGTDPYPWPYDGCMDADRLALVLAGWDEGWAGRCPAGDRAGARLGTTEPDAARAACVDLAAAVTDVGGLVVTVAHSGAVPLGRPTPSTQTLRADGIDGCYGGPLDPVLRRAGRTHLVVAGFGLEGPVHSTLRSANDRGYECLLVADACASLEPELVAAALLTVTMSGGIFGAVGSLEPTLAALANLPTRSLLETS